jgi:hypothetical protein
MRLPTGSKAQRPEMQFLRCGPLLDTSQKSRIVSDQSQAEARGMSPSAVAPDESGKELSGLLLILSWEQELSRAELLP